MRIVITGSTGFIGKNLYARLKELDKEVVCISHSRLGKSQWENNPDFHFGSLTDEKFLKSVLLPSDCVVHLGYTTVPGNSVQNPVFDVDSNVNAALNLLRVCKEVRIGKFIFISTGGVIYGNQTELPIVETASLNPYSSYGITKLIIEKLIPLYLSDYCILRAGNVYGPGHDSARNQGVINIWIKNILQSGKIDLYGDGKITRDYIYITDFIDALRCVIEDPHQEGEVYNLGSGKGYNLLEILQILKEIAGKEFTTTRIQARNFDVHANVLSMEKFGHRYKWNPAVSIEMGIRQLWLSYQLS